LRPEHLSRFQPVCPTCRQAGRSLDVLELGPVVREVDGDVIEGVLLCPEPTCRREHPIVDGVPIVVSDIQAFLTSQLDAILAREDLSHRTRSMLGDGLAGDAWFHADRNIVSSYARSHYASPRRGVMELLTAGLELLGNPPSGLWLDAGCSVGRTAFELAARTAEPVLAVDLSFSMLRVARRLQVHGETRVPLRRGGLVCDEVRLTVETPHRDQVSFWACDATALPFPNARFDGAVSLNVVDCVLSPVTHLAELGRVLVPGGAAILTTPYDWTGGVSPVAGWIGGHSQRSESGGDSVVELRRLLSEASPPELGIRLRLESDRERIPWRVQVHDRSAMDYEVHLVLARSRG